MTDRKLLELAAKAAGVVGEYVENYSTGDYYGDQFYVGPDCGILTSEGHLASVWNPLTEDGDALRLAVKLKFHIFIDSDDVSVDTPTDEAAIGVIFIDDPYAATRSAIVRAAAAIGGGL